MSHIGDITLGLVLVGGSFAYLVSRLLTAPNLMVDVFVVMLVFAFGLSYIYSHVPPAPPK